MKRLSGIIGNGSKLECFEGMGRYYVYEFVFLKKFTILWSDVDDFIKEIVSFWEKMSKTVRVSLT